MPTQGHKTARLKFARNHMTWYEEWKNVVFFNTKSNLHEPDAFKYYSHNLRTDKAVAMSRNFDGGCLIVWTAFNYSKMSICKICIRMNAEKYINLLEDCLIPFIEENHEENVILQ